MKLQTAIDRVTLKKALELVAELQESDIIEIGTSLTKDYGIEALKEIKKVNKMPQLLADIKTIDEGEYEFKQYFNHGADILTVMGAAAVETLELCYQVAEEYEKEMMIDLLECTDEKIQKISHFEKAIYLLHFSKDSQKEYSALEKIDAFKKKFPTIKRLALAGSLNLQKVKSLKGSGLEIVVVGSSIVKQETPRKEVKKFKEVL